KTKLTTSQIQKLSKKYDASINSKSEMLMVWDRLTGGLIFVGGVVSIVLVIGIFLMMYYKQVSEAYANQHNYDIMKKLGLDNGRIAKITRNQMTFLFAIPITVALIHTLISSNIVYTLLNMIGINNHHIFLTSYVLTVIIISFLYMAMYKITSYIYAKVIHQQRN
ncbi:TPA: ABC transporter permease, partial [Staphylococcus aureus]|nr:ABC transporter permease [Staphylococcus aureus]